MMGWPSWILRMSRNVQSLEDLRRVGNRYGLNTISLLSRLFLDFKSSAVVLVTGDIEGTIQYIAQRTISQKGDVRLRQSDLHTNYTGIACGLSSSRTM